MKKSLLGALALGLATSTSAFAQTEIQWWHAMTGANNDVVNKLAEEFNASQKDYKVVVSYKGQYADTLNAAGYTASVQTVGQRETYLPALEAGDFDVFPEYVGTLTEYLDGNPDEAVASSDLDATVQVLRPLGEAVGLTFGQQIDDVGADEPGSAGHEDHAAPGYTVPARARRDPAGPQRTRRAPLGARADAGRLHAARRRQRVHGRVGRARGVTRGAGGDRTHPGVRSRVFRRIDGGDGRDRVLHGLRRVL